MLSHSKQKDFPSKSLIRWKRSTCMYLIVMFGYYYLKKKKIMFGNNIQDKMIFSVSYLVIVSKT